MHVDFWSTRVALRNVSFVGNIAQRGSQLYSQSGGELSLQSVGMRFSAQGDTQFDIERTGPLELNRTSFVCPPGYLLVNTTQRGYQSTGLFDVPLRADFVDAACSQWTTATKSLEPRVWSGQSTTAASLALQRRELPFKDFAALTCASTDVFCERGARRRLEHHAAAVLGLPFWRRLRDRRCQRELAR